MIWVLIVLIAIDLFFRLASFGQRQMHEKALSESLAKVSESISNSTKAVTEISKAIDNLEIIDDEEEEDEEEALESEGFDVEENSQFIKGTIKAHVAPQEAIPGPKDFMAFGGDFELEVGDKILDVKTNRLYVVSDVKKDEGKILNVTYKPATKIEGPSIYYDMTSQIVLLFDGEKWLNITKEFMVGLDYGFRQEVLFDKDKNPFTEFSMGFYEDSQFNMGDFLKGFFQKYE